MAEWRAIRALDKNLSVSRDANARLRIYPFRFDDTEIPGVLDDMIYCDARRFTPQQIADLILQRLAQLQLSRKAPDNPPLSEALVPQGDSRINSTPAGQGRSWVWRSTLDSQAAGRVSVLACTETLGAVALYWWIAIRYETHWHLVSSVFIAPLLLLRSPESMAAGVSWFLKDWFGFEGYEQWPRRKKASWIVGLALFSALPTYSFAHWLSGRWLPGLEGWPLFGWATAIGAVALTSTTAIAIAAASLSARAALEVGAGVVACAVVVVIAGPGTGLVTSPGVVVVAVVGLSAGLSASVIAAGPGIGSGVAMRGLFFRVLAALRYLPTGVRRLPNNWRENNLLTNSLVPAELMPGIRDAEPWFALDVFTKAMIKRQGRLKFLVYPPLGTFFFLPAFLYRLNIKATAWFWCPLAYLLKPAPVADAESHQKQALCWPWTNPFQKLWIGASVLLVLVSLTLHNLDPASWVAMKNLPALPLAMKVSLAIDWTHLAPWHWAQWIIAGAGAGMLVLAGNARRHDLNGNWRDYRERWARNIRLMTGLQRVRTLATLALLFMALGAPLLQDRSWQTYLSIPESWVRALEQFYRIRP